jgi:hypothetical protein
MKLLKKIATATLEIPDRFKALSNPHMTLLVPRPETKSSIRAFDESGNELHTDDRPERNELFVRVPTVDKFVVRLCVEDEENDPWKDYEVVNSIEN